MYASDLRIRTEQEEAEARAKKALEQVGLDLLIINSLPLSCPAARNGGWP